MKKLCLLTAAMLVLSLLTACGGPPPVTTDPYPEIPLPEEASLPEEPVWTGVLYADFCCGQSGVEAERIVEYPFGGTSGDITANQLAIALSNLTGLDFTISAVRTADGWTVDWAPGSTLVAGLDDRTQKEDFTFSDADSMRWFMMDSLWRTLTVNLAAENIYYTMDGGKPLSFDALSPVSQFPPDLPYLGSIFYFAHGDTQGDAGEGPFVRTAGLWRLEGSLNAPRIEMDGAGSFSMFQADGTLDTVGYLDYVDEYGDGNLRYDLYTQDGQLLSGFSFDSDTRIHFGNDGGSVYLLDTGAAAILPPALIWPGRFTGLESMENNDQFQGGYLYRDLTEDTLTVITNCCIRTERLPGDDLEDYILQVILETTGRDARSLTMEECPEDSQRISYPVCRLTWKAGHSEDTRGCTGFFFQTDTHTYLFSFDTAIDHQEEMLETWNAAFDTLILQ